MRFWSYSNSFAWPHTRGWSQANGTPPIQEFDGISIAANQISGPTAPWFFVYNAKWVTGCSNKVRPLLDSIEQSVFSLDNVAIKAIKLLKDEIGKAMLIISEEGQPLIMTTDAPRTAIGGKLSQNNRPVAFFSRSLSPSEMKQTSVERDAMAIIECCRKWARFIRSFHSVIQTERCPSFSLETKARLKMRS